MEQRYEKFDFIDTTFKMLGHTTKQYPLSEAGGMEGKEGERIVIRTPGGGFQIAWIALDYEKQRNGDYLFKVRKFDSTDIVAPYDNLEDATAHMLSLVEEADNPWGNKD